MNIPEILASSAMNPETLSDCLYLIHVQRFVTHPLPRQRLTLVLQRVQHRPFGVRTLHNRLEHAPCRLRADVEAHIAWLEQCVAALDNDLDTTLRASPVWRERETLYRSVPGIGPV